MRARRRWLRWLKRIVLGTAATVLVALVALVIIVHTDWGRERVRRIVVSQLQDTFPGGATIGRIEGSPFGELVLRDVEIRAVDGREMLRAGALRVDAALFALLGHTIRLHHVTGEDLTLFLPRTPIPPEKEPDDEPSPWTIEAPDIKLVRAKVVFDGTAAPITLDGVELAAAIAIPAGGSMRVAAVVHGTWRERGVPVEATLKNAQLDTVPRIAELHVTVGGVTVAGTDLAIDPGHPGGTLLIGAPAAAVTALVPGLVLPADLKLSLTATPAGRETALELTGKLGGSPVHGSLRGDLEARAIRGIVTASDVELAAITRGAVAGRGSATVAITVAPPVPNDPPAWLRARAVVIASGKADGMPGTAVVSLDAAIDANRRLTRASAFVVASGAGGAYVTGNTVVKQGAPIVDPHTGAITPMLVIDRAHVIAGVRDAAAASAGRVPVTGVVTADLTISGELSPAPAITVHGRVRGEQVVYRDRDAPRRFDLRRLDAKLHGFATATQLTGDATVDLRGLARDGKLLGDAVVTARRPAGQPIWASVTAHPAAAVPEVYADALITPGAVTQVVLGLHRVTMPSGEAWSGRGGRVVVTEDAVTLRDLRTTNRDGHVDVEADYGRLTGDLSARLEADAIAAASIDPRYRGTASGTIALARKRLRWDGNASLEADGLAFTAGASPISGDLTAMVVGGRVKVSANAAAAFGGVALELDVDGPPEFTDVAAWQALERAAVRSTTISLKKVDLAGASVPAGGIVNGKIFIAGASTNGTLSVAGVHTPLGEIDADLTFRPEDRSELGAIGHAHVVGLGDADLTARIAFPSHPFDPAAWNLLGRGALSSLVVKLDDISIDPKKLAALKITAPYRGTANVGLTVERGATYAKAQVALTGITGGALVQPVDVELVAETDASGTRGGLHVFAARAPAAAAAPRLELVSVDAALPITFDRWIAAPDRAIYAPITGTLAIAGRDDRGQPKPPLAAASVLALVGRADVVSGTLDGTATVGGTLGTPTVSGKFYARQIAIVDRIENRQIPTLELLTIEAIWGGVAGSVVINGNESGATKDRPRTLYATVSGRPSDLKTITGRINIQKFDLVPLAAFLPGPLVAAQGTLDANLSMTSVLAPGTLRGSLDLTDARVPLAPTIGTLRRGTATLRLDDTGLIAKLSGKLGAGAIELEARSADHDLSAIGTKIAASAIITKVSPIGDLEPVIGARIDGTFERAAAQWRAKLKVSGGSVVLPPTSGTALLVADAPADLYFLDGRAAKPPGFALGRRPPVQPWLIADVELGDTKIEAEDLYNTSAEIAGQVRVLVGESVGMTGKIEILRGDVGDLVGRSYRAEGALTFDGTTDPSLDITLSHTFPEMTLTATLKGRLSNPNPPEFGGSTIYTQDQLAGFFLGGEPGGDPASQTREAATGATVSLVSSKLGRRVRKALPGKISVLRCEPGSSAVGASCTAGRWFGSKLFVAGKLRLDARPQLENTGEVQVQYYLQRELLLEGVGGDGNHDGVDLLWRRRW